MTTQSVELSFGRVSVSSADPLTINITYDYTNLRGLGEACIWASADYLEIIDDVAELRELPDEYGTAIRFNTNRSMVAFLKDLIARLEGVMKDEKLRPFLPARA